MWGFGLLKSDLVLIFHSCCLLLMMSLCCMRCSMQPLILTKRLDLNDTLPLQDCRAFCFQKGSMTSSVWKCTKHHGFYLFNKASIKNDYITLWKHELATCSERLLHHHSGRFMTCLGFITFFLTAKEQILLNFPAFSGNDYMIGAPDYFW